MKRREFVKKYALRFSAALLLVGLMLYTVYHVVNASSASLITTPARLYTDHKMLAGRADLFREEQVLSVAGNGVVNDLVASGAKVSKDTELAEVWNGYANPLDAKAAQIGLERLERLISVLERSEVKNGTAADAQVCRQEASALLLEIQRAKVEGDWGEIGGLCDRMLVYLNRYQTLTANGEGYGELLEELRAQKSALLVGSRTAVSSALGSGFYFDRTQVDGKESFYTVDLLNTLTPASLDALRRTESTTREDETVAGKLVFGYTWYLAADLVCDASAFEVGAYYDVVFPSADDNTLGMQCHAVNPGEDGRVAVVFSCDEMPAWLTWERTRTIEIALDSVTGLYVPESALVEQDGVLGVYIYSDSVVRFRRVEVLRRGDGYCVVSQNSEDENYLALYDILILSGKKLYDGKVYQ